MASPPAKGVDRIAPKDAAAVASPAILITPAKAPTLMKVIHKTVPVQVWVDVDEGIADTVRYLNTIAGVRTLASCQGTLDEGGPNPYPPQVMVSWDNPDALAKLLVEFAVELLHENLAYVRPKNLEL